MSEYHPDGYVLESFARGEIHAAEGRWIEDHLRSGCPICQATVDSLLPRLTETRPPLAPRQSFKPLQTAAPAASLTAPAVPSLPAKSPARRRRPRRGQAAAFVAALQPTAGARAGSDADADAASYGGSAAESLLEFPGDILRTSTEAPTTGAGAPRLHGKDIRHDAGLHETWDLRSAPAASPARFRERRPAAGGRKRSWTAALPLPPERQGPLDLASSLPAADRALARLRPNPLSSKAAEMPENEIWDRIFARLEQRLALISLEREGAPRLIAELLRRPPFERAAVVRTSRRMHTLALCDLLIEKSFEAGFRDCAEAVSLAELGILVADHLDMRHYGSAVVHDMKSRAWAHLGNARRISSDLSGAEQALDFAESLADDGSADPLEEARLLDLRASLLSDQGWFEEAADLLDSVIEIYEEVKDLHRKGRALISKGVNLGMCGRPQRAVELIPEGLALLDWELEPRLVLMARHNFAWFLNDCGHCERAKRQLDSFRQSYSAFADIWTELGLEWLEARIAHRCGHFDEAGQRFEKLRQSFLDRGRGYEAAMVILDLVHVYLDEGRRSEVRRLTEEMLPILRSEDVHRQAAAALVALQHAASVDLINKGLVQEVAAYLQRARKNPRLTFERAA